jgi:hypothetical protein
MTDNPMTDKDNRLSDRVSGMGRREIIGLVEKLCGIVSAQAGEDGFRGGVRPGNISLGADGSVALGPGGKPERDHWTAEELEFMAPEEFWNGECTGASDVYSIGLVLYYCVSGGKLPFEPDKDELTAEDRAATLRRRMSGERIRAPHNAGKSLGAVIEKAVSFNAEDRYSNASDMPVVLELCMKELDNIDRPDGGKIFEKSDDELTDVEKMMVGIISRAAEDAALSEEDIDEVGEDAEKTEDTGTAESEPEQPDEPEQTPKQDDAAQPEPEPEPETEPEPQPEPDQDTAPEGEPETEPEREAVEEPTMVMRTQEQKPAEVPPDRERAERTAAMPAVQYAMGKEQSKPGKKGKKGSGRKKIILLLLLCAVIIVAAIVIKSFTGNQAGSAQPSATQAAESTTVPTQTPTPTPTATPTPTPSPTPTTAPQPTYEIFMSDISWTDAEKKCEEMGGHLVVVDSQEVLNKVAALAASKGARFVWLGCYRDSDGQLKWVNKENVTFYNWAKGEPSGTESDGTTENYVILWNTEKDLSGNWEYNDVGDDPVAIYPKGYSGKIAYICQKDG